MLSEIYYWKQMVFDLIDAKRCINDHILEATQDMLEDLKDSEAAKPFIFKYLD
jgi:hypothetical protein